MCIHEERSQQKLLSETIYESIRENIINRTYLPGMKLTEKYFADYLSVSRTPIREALKKLSREGLVDDVPNKGAFVKNITDQEINDIAEALSTMEKKLNLRLISVTEVGLKEWTTLVEMIVFFGEKGSSRRMDKTIIEMYDFLLSCIYEKYLRENFKSMDRLLKERQKCNLQTMDLNVKLANNSNILKHLYCSKISEALHETMRFKERVQCGRYL